MSRLWIRLSLAFGLVVISSMLLLTGIASTLSRDPRITDALLRRFEVPRPLIQQLGSLYVRDPGWAGVDVFLRVQEDALPRAPMGRLALVLADASGRIVYDRFGDRVGEMMPPADREIATQIIVNGALVGYLRLEPVAELTPDGETTSFFQQQFVELLLLISLVVGSVSTVAGIGLSRTLTAPLNRLAATARRFGAKDFTARAEVRGGAEVTEVAHAFNEMADALERAELQRRVLLADIAHELRTPLTVLKSNLQAILDGLYDFSHEEAEHLLQQTDLLSRLVADLHDLSQAEAHQLRLELDLLDLPTFAQKQAGQYKALCEAQGLALHVEAGPQPVLISADASRLGQVLHNLLSNAITHTPSGGSITLRAAREGASAVLSVQDTGVGIPPEHLPHIFERFYRVDKSRTRATGGTGLGLAIVRAILELHGARVEAHSEGVPGKGTTFVITFPLADAA
jgi:two-component system OmpR family sensor kinase/two-component system sensor histidine kinase BaeS